MNLDIPHAQFTLPNGLNVLIHEDRSLPVVAVNVWYHVGSKNERPGRTGFAHLFEHIMFEGSAHVPEGDFDNLLEVIGGVNNGSTTPDRTNYWETVPSNALELALWLEADRMGWLLETMDQPKLDLQRAVVMNERRQSYENRPYGLAFETVLAALYPPEHPYHWPTIGSMDDLSAATLGDVRDFFRTYYRPNNASLAVAGDVSVAEVEDLAERCFGEIPAGPPVPEVRYEAPSLEEDRYETLEDDVQLPRLYMTWHGPKAYEDDDAALEFVASILAQGRSSRLYRRLVYEEQVAQEVSAFTNGGEIGGAFFVVATAKPGVALSTLETAIREEIGDLATAGPTAIEIERTRNQVEARFVDELQRVGGFGGRADRLNEYFTFTGTADFLSEDLARFRRLGTERVGDAAADFLDDARAVVLSVVPVSRPELGAAVP